MSDDQLGAMLEALQWEQGDVEQRVKQVQQELREAENRLTDLNTAIAALKRLQAGGEHRDRAGNREVSDFSDAAAGPRHVISGSPDAVVPGARRTDVPERLRKYVPAGGQRLRSKLMVFDLLQNIGRPVTRDELRHEFFDFYGREELETYWMRPENALNTAIDRAVEDQLILEHEEAHGGPAVYTPHFRDTASGLPALYSEEHDR
ncbi:hypothetical protein [Mycobacterium pseudokansasii]|uniref:hypothetical protein n=1 Tax=Mycobacterium pseudokansasii TaxID=2341080 RepID=UPI0010A9587A|nr:hypothetical protein [Mycobacterium pseudokansasii]